MRQITLEEGQRQVVVLALSELSLLNPGWLPACEEIALMIDNKLPDGKAELFEKFRRMRSDIVAERLAADPHALSFEPGYPTQSYT